MVASAISLVAACQAVAQTHEFAATETSWSLPATGRGVQVLGGLGDVSVVKAPDDKITVDVTRGADGSIVPRIVVVESAKEVTVCADWTTAAGAPSACGSGNRPLATNSMKNYARADLRIAVPSGTDVRAFVSKGNITSEPVGASLRLKSYDGNISGTADGAVFTADNLHGAIEMRVGDQMQKQKLEAHTLDGTIHMIIPPERLLHYTLYASGAVMRSQYEVEDEQDYAAKGAATHLYRLSKNDITGNIGPPKLRGPWATLEVYVTNKDVGKIEFTKP